MRPEAMGTRAIGRSPKHKDMNQDQFAPDLEDACFLIQ